MTCMETYIYMLQENCVETNAKTRFTAQFQLSQDGSQSKQ